MATRNLKNKVQRTLLLLLCCVMLFSCKKQEKTYSSTPIRKAGVYKLNDSLTLDVKIENALVIFKVKNSIGVSKIETIHPFSDYQSWAMYYDNNAFWIFSSDIGHGCFVPNVNGKYIYQQVPRQQYREKIPPKLVKELSEFNLSY